MTDNTISFAERIANYHSQLPMCVYIIMCTIIIILSILYLIRIETQKRKLISNKVEKNNKSTREITAERRIKSALSFVIIVLIIWCLCVIDSMIETYHTAVEHGYRAGYMQKADSLWKSIHLSPIEDEVPDDDTQALFICYRFACPDCEAIYEELMDTFPQGSQNTYWIASRSEQGKTLIEKYPIDQVPSAIYVKKDGTYLTYILYRETKDGSVIDRENLEALKKAMSQDAKQ